jgi:hypothetical protein
VRGVGDAGEVGVLVAFKSSSDEVAELHILVLVCWVWVVGCGLLVDWLLVDWLLVDWLLVDWLRW